MEAGLLRGAIGFESVAFNAGAHDIFPGGWAAAVAGNNVIQIEVFAVKNVAAILAGVFVPLKDVMTCELHFLLREMIVDDEQNHPWNANSKGDGMDRFRMRFLTGQIVPLVEVVRLERTIAAVEHDLSVALKQKSQGAAGSANIDRLPEAIQH